MRSLIVLAVLSIMASGCLLEEDEPAPQRPSSTYMLTTEEGSEFEERFDTPSCSYSRQEPRVGQYSIDARMVEQPNAENPAVIQLRFPGSVDVPPSAGEYMMPDDADLTATFEAPLGSMDGSAGMVTVTELADFRKIDIEGTVTGATQSAELVATLYCPL